MENFKKIETVRHGEKQGEQLSEIGIGQAKEKAMQIFSEIKEAPAGAVFYVLPSNVGRAIETRNTIENELKNLLKDDQTIEFISAKDLDRVRGTDDYSKKYIVTDILPSLNLGFDEKTTSIPAFLEYKKLFKNDEDLIGMTWASKNNETESLKNRIKAKFPDFELGLIDSKKFIETPEEAAIKYLRVMETLIKLSERYFPGHASKGVHVGHNLSADFAVMAIAGKEISLNSIDEFGGKFRDFLESAEFEFKGSNIAIKYRGKELTQGKEINEIIHDLKIESNERRNEWRNEK